VQAGGQPGQLHVQELPGVDRSSAANEVEIERALVDRGVPTRQDLHQLAEQIEALRAKLDRIA